MFDQPCNLQRGNAINLKLYISWVIKFDLSDPFGSPTSFTSSTCFFSLFSLLCYQENNPLMCPWQLWSFRHFWVCPSSPTLQSTHSSSSSSIQIHQEHRRSPGMSNYIPRFWQYLRPKVASIWRFTVTKKWTRNKLQKLLPNGDLQDRQQHFQVINCSKSICAYVLILIFCFLFPSK